MPVMKDAAKIERNCRRIYGCGISEALELNGHVPLRTVGSPAQRYVNHKSHATSRGVEWCFTFPEWLKVWMDSGKWSLRGNRGASGYVMARQGDVGPYAVWNVYICSNSQNAKDGHANGVMHTVSRKPAAAIRGYSIDRSCPNRPYQVRVAGKHIGYFSTPEEATKAYWKAIDNR